MAHQAQLSTHEDLDTPAPPTQQHHYSTPLSLQLEG